METCSCFPEFHIKIPTDFDFILGVTMTFKSVDAVLLFAIGKEEEAAGFYRGLAGRMEMP